MAPLIKFDTTRLDAFFDFDTMNGRFAAIDPKTALERRFKLPFIVFSAALATVAAYLFKRGHHYGALGLGIAALGTVTQLASYHERVLTPDFKLLLDEVKIDLIVQQLSELYLDKARYVSQQFNLQKIISMDRPDSFQRGKKIASHYDTLILAGTSQTFQGLVEKFRQQKTSFEEKDKTGSLDPTYKAACNYLVSKFDKYVDIEFREASYILLSHKRVEGTNDYTYTSEPFLLADDKPFDPLKVES
jgi:hypothetical protein